jgi:crossover junction endodeoxyribonuclease RuvC
MNEEIDINFSQSSNQLRTAHFTMEKKEKYRIIGVDPGTNFLGYAILEVNNKALSLVSMSTLALSHLNDQNEKLKRIFEKMDWAIKTFEPDQMSIEQPFYGKNIQSMLKLGRAQGVAMAAAIHNNIPVVEYLPKVVKKSVVGNGNAAKEQVAAMLGHILGRPIEPSYYDASDALALAVCHFYQTSNMMSKGKKSDTWKAFMQDNPKRVAK